MDYINMSREELIQENIRLRSELAQLMGGKMITFNAINNEVISPKTPYMIWPELCCRFSPDLKITFVNEAFADFLNRNEEIIGQNLLSLFDKKYHEKIMDVLYSLNQNHPISSLEYTWTDVNNKLRYRHWKIQATFNQYHSLIEYIAVGRDITEHKEAEEKIRYRLNIEHAMAKASNLLVSSDQADINEILKIIGKAIAVNRVHLFEFSEDLDKMKNTYVWCTAHTTSAIRSMQNMNTEVFNWGLKEFLQGNNIVIADRNNLPFEAGNEKDFMEKHGIYAALLVPITGTDDKLLGYIGFNDTEQSRFWKDADIQCLSMLTKMIGAYWQRKKMEQALRASEAKFRTLADTAPAMIFVYSQPAEDAPLRYLNKGYEAISGYQREVMLGKSFWDAIHPDFRELIKERAIARLTGETIPTRYEIKLLNQTDKGCWGDMAVNPIEWEGEPAVIGIIYNITERKQMEEEQLQSRDDLEKRVIDRTAELVSLNEKLQQEVAERQQAEAELILSETRYRAIIENQAELVVRALPNGSITFVNEAYCNYFGKKPAELMGESLVALIYEEDQGAVIRKLHSLSFDYLEDIHTLRAVRADGRICWQEWTARAILKGQEIIEIQAVGRDVNERVLAEEALQRSETNFRKLAETAPALIFVYRDGHFLYLNSMFESIMNLSREQLFEMNPMDLLHPDCRELAIKNSAARQDGEKVPPYEVSMLNKNGQYLWGYLYGDIIDYEGSAAILGMVVDITERKKMEEALLQASKLDSLGILAGGIAHDFNNILTVISGNISLAKMIIDTDNEVMEVLDEVEKAAFQARDLTQQLLTFSKGGAPIKETASIQELLRESASFVLRGSNVNCNYSIADDLWPVSIDKGQINQVINNLIINADQAMPDGGSIQLSALNISSGFDYLPSLKSTKYIKICIKDSGMGIAEKHLPKIFDPYFTTKPKGHGLGLATCYSIIKKHDGDINIISKLGRGTTVNIYLPAFPDQLVKADHLTGMILHGQGKILIMDDESLVRETLGKMLQHLGYTTGFAGDGLNAVYVYQCAKLANEPYDAVLMDLTIAGGMGGKEAVKKILEIDSQAKVIVSSGYSNDPVMANYKQYGFCGILPKPYEIQAVNKLLYELINRQEAG